MCISGVNVSDDNNDACNDLLLHVIGPSCTNHFNFSVSENLFNNWHEKYQSDRNGAEFYVKFQTFLTITASFISEQTRSFGSNGYEIGLNWFRISLGFVPVCLKSIK